MRHIQEASHLYHWYIYLSNLTNKLKKINYQGSDHKTLHIGDSHSISFAHQTINLLSKPTYIQPVLIFGGKAWHFANKQKNRFKSSLKEQVKNHTDIDQIFISFGDLDCRKNEGIIYYSIKYKSKICKYYY